MRKIVLLDDFFPTGEQTLQPVLMCAGWKQDTSRICKTASEALEYIKHVSPEPGKTAMLVLALGAEESYGPNRNGDGFPEHPVPARHKYAASGERWWVAPGEELTKHYQTFERGHSFKHHVNKDPAKASGHVKKAFWNPRMHRVELLIIVDNQKDPEWVQRVNDGDFPAVSMGCRIKYDVCSICGNRAPTRAQYCDHVTQDPGMNGIMPNGQKAYVHNPSPNFFDISRVFRPADRTGYTLKKVAYVYEVQSSAELGEVAENLDAKAAAIHKLSDIEKIVRGEPVASSSNLAPEEQTVIRRFKDYVGPRLGKPSPLPIDKLCSYAPATLFSTLTSLGIKLSSAEFLDYILTRVHQRPIKLAASLADRVIAMQPTVLQLYGASPALLDEVIKTGALDESPSCVSTELRTALQPYAVKRAQFGEMLYRRLVPEGIGIRPDAAPTTDMLSYTDPASGQSYQTTRGAAIDARDMQTSADLRRMVGGGAMLLGAYKLLTMHPALRPWKLPLGIGAAALGLHTLRPGGHPQYQTQEGLSIPQMTEFAQADKAASENVTATVVGLIEDHARLQREKIATKHAGALVQNLVSRALNDSVRGVEISVNDAADAVGLAICS